VAAGGLVSCAVVGGVPSCWGPNDSGQLGRDSEDATAPVQGISGVRAMAVSSMLGCAIVGAGVECWGAEQAAPFAKSCLRMTAHTGGGGGSPAQWPYCATPTMVTGLTDPIAVSAASSGACAIAGDAVTCWDGATLTKIPL
jgi:hypothetical protein